MGKFINPFTDYGFKKIFGQEVSKELLIEFLNDLLEGERVITDLTLKAVYGVFFINFLLDENQKLRTDVILTDRDTGKLFSDKLRQIFIALPLFNKTEAECETDFERWIFVLNNMETLNRMPFKAQKAVFEKLEEIVDVHSLSEEDRVRYENSVNAYRDYLATIDYAAKKGVEEGFEDGLQKGIQEGIQEGIRKGQQEKALEIARSMKAMGMTSEQIMKVTGLSLAEIESLL